MQTSAPGIAALEAEEGVVLRAYRDVVGVWTIGAGLTAASGVVVPKAGMVITKAEATNLLQRALREKYEPAVSVAMSKVAGAQVTRPKQHEFDAGVSFHFNTGAIRKASWVRKWLAGASHHDVRTALKLWNKGGGKVLPGLERRRAREAAMLLEGLYPRPSRRVEPVGPGPVYANWALQLSPGEIEEVKEALRKLSYDPGPGIGQVLADAVRRFQLDHGLTVDGIIGRATLSTLQRRLDAPRAAAKPAAAAALPIAATTDVGSAYADALGATGADLVALGLVGLWGLSTAWRYRDVIAAKIARPAPRIATFLRSF